MTETIRLTSYLNASSGSALVELHVGTGADFIQTRLGVNIKHFRCGHGQPSYPKLLTKRIDEVFIALVELDIGCKFCTHKDGQ